MKQEQHKRGNDYRYPGSRPFNDTGLDRSLFFGREEEIELLFQSVLLNNLFVLYAKSGMGKTSLLNAGLMERLREKDFLPLSIRFNDPQISPLNTVYTGIEEAVNRQKRIDYEPGEMDSLWQFFKTAAFWSPHDKPLIPVLIFDQFEEFFILHKQEEREVFIAQMADLVMDRVPKTLRYAFESEGHFPYSETPPKVKIVISIREDYLGHLEEFADAVPDVLHNRLRLPPLTRAQAKDAIIKPAQLPGDDFIRSQGGSYTGEAVDEMLDFLCERREMGKTIKTDEVEPLQLQLLCRHIEEKVRQKAGQSPGVYMVKPGDLGGRTGMKNVLQGFYENRLKVLSTPWKRRKVRKLCEKGLIFNKRRSIMDEGRIIKKYKVSKELLSLLVDNRLLRSEPRLGTIFYELSQDTFVEPILKSRRKRKIRQLSIGIPTAVLILIIFAFTGIMDSIKKEFAAFVNKQYVEALELKHQGNYRKAIKVYSSIPRGKKESFPLYLEIGKLYEDLNEFDNAKSIYLKAIENGVRHAAIYYKLGEIYAREENTWKEAIDNYKIAVQLNPGYISAWVNRAEVTLAARKFKEAYNMAQIILEKKEISTVHELVMRLIAFLSLIFQEKPSKAIEEFDGLFEAYRTLPNYRAGTYAVSRKFIRKSRLKKDEKNLLLNLIKILESPEKAGDEELKELEAKINKIFKR